MESSYVQKDQNLNHLENKKQYWLKEQFFNPDKNDLKNDWTTRLNTRFNNYYGSDNNSKKRITK